MAARSLSALTLVAAALVLSIATPLVASSWKRLAPYDALRWEGQKPLVRVEGEWFELHSIEGLVVSELFAASQRRFGSQWRQRFTEDLMEVLEEAGVSAHERLTLGLSALADPKEKGGPGPMRLVEVDLSAAKRRALLDFVRSNEVRGTLEEALHERWSYVEFLRGAALEEFIALTATQEETTDAFGSNPDEVSDSNRLILAAQRVIGSGIDGHAEVRGWRAALGGARFLPFLVGPSAAGPVAFHADRSSLVDPAHPILEAIDGRSIEDWCDRISAYVPDGSPQFVRRECFRHLRELEGWRVTFGEANPATTRVTLVSADRGSRRVVELPLAERRPIFGAWPRTESGIRSLSAGSETDLPIGYLRLASFSGSAAVEEIERWLPRFAAESSGVAALIIDVRGNGGGSRDALLALDSWLSDPHEPPRVVNAARYVLHPDHLADHLGGSRYLFRAASERLTARERVSAQAFAEDFQVEQRARSALVNERWSDWHYLVLGGTTARSLVPSGGRPEGSAPFRGPVVVLQDERCFSATDIFLAGLRSLPRVTLIGTASGGGSARVQSVTTDNELTLRIGSMISFQADGRLFDGHGVPPDLPVQPNPSWYVDGGRDRAYEQAVVHLETQLGQPSSAPRRD